MQPLHGCMAYLDTNLFIYVLEAYEHPNASAAARLLQRIERGEVSGVTSELTLAELLVVPLRIGNVEQATRCKHLIASRAGFTVAPVDRRTLIEAATLRATHRLKLPDAIHIATARLHGCDLIVTSDADWHRVAGLPVISPNQVN